MKFSAICSILISFVGAATLNFDWEIKEGIIAPDNYAVEGILINGQFPGPTINATVGDTIIVKVRNRLQRGFSIHWHGMTQKGTVKSDGVPYVTQPPIKPNNDYIYKFHVEQQAGTWWYHAHTHLDAEHAFGALIVKEKKAVWKDAVKFEPKYNYDEDRVVLLSEFWHTPSEEMYAGLTQTPFKFLPRTDSILTNGMTYQQWSTNGTDNSTVPFNNGYNVINVQKGKTYRLRLIGANGLSFLSFSIPGHKFTLIEVEGTLIEPIEVDHVEINAGQRYSVLMKADQAVDNYYAYTQFVGGNTNTENGISIIHYNGAKSADPLRRQVVTPPSPTGPLTRWVEGQLATSKWYLKGLNSHFYPVPKKATKEIVMNVVPAVDNGLPIFTINDVIQKPRTNTIVDDVLNGQHVATPGVYEITEGQNVQLIMQHFVQSGRICASHPWHLHGHSFFIVGQGSGVYNSSIDGVEINNRLANSSKIPIYRDTFTQYPSDLARVAASHPGQRSDTFGVTIQNQNTFENLNGISNSRIQPSDVPCGWYAIRFKADNPGSWFMHCHITAHLIMGKQLVINESPKKYN